MYIFKSGWRVRLDLCFGTRLLLLDTEPLCMSGDKMYIFKSGWRVCYRAYENNRPPIN